MSADAPEDGAPSPGDAAPAAPADTKATPEPPAQEQAPPAPDGDAPTEAQPDATAPAAIVAPAPVADLPTETAEPAGLVARGLGKRYLHRTVLHDVDIALSRGEAVGLLGPNGAGKTTCFYMMVGLTACDRGTIELEGQDVTALPMHRRARLGLGYLPQEASIFRGLTVEQNLRAMLEIIEPVRDKREKRIEELLGEFSITHLRGAPATALSGGERRRVEIARCLASDPAYVLLDEPFAGVDPIAVGDIRSLVAHLKDRKIGVLITDHNVRETLQIIDRAYILHEGSVLMSGDPAQVVGDEKVRQVYLGEDFSI